jgi:hypothetical protein
VDAIARHEAALAQAEENRLARLARQQRITAEVREREIADLRLQSTRHQAWQRNVDAAARNAIAYKQRQTLLGELEKMLSPPAPPPPPEAEQIVYVSEDEGSPDLGDRDFNVKAWMKKSRPWW